MATRRTLLSAAALLPALARAQTFPARPLRLIVTYPPGGVTDIVGRLIAEPLARELGQPVVVENRAGAGGNIGAQAAAGAEPDGHTLMLGTSAIFGVNPVMYAAQGVDLLRALLPFVVLGEVANILSVSPRRLPDVTDVPGLIRAARARPLLYGSVGNGSSSHMSAVAFLRAAGVAAEHVPYRGSAALVPAMLAGDLDFMFDTTATSATHIAAGTLRALAVTTARRAEALPAVPALREFGDAGLGDYELGIWFGLFAPARTPPAVLTALGDAAARAAATPEFAARLRAANVDPLTVARGELAAWLAADAARWQALARAANIRAD